MSSLAILHFSDIVQKNSQRAVKPCPSHCRQQLVVLLFIEVSMNSKYVGYFRLYAGVITKANLLVP